MSLYDYLARSHKGDPASSFSAADRVRPRAQLHHEIILQALKSGPATAKDLADRTGLEYHAVARRMSELIRSGRAVRSPLAVQEGEGRRVSLYRLP
jgi:predicted ArsR family transcriptional regulator